MRALCQLLLFIPDHNNRMQLEEVATARKSAGVALGGSPWVTTLTTSDVGPRPALVSATTFIWYEQLGWRPSNVYVVLYADKLSVSCHVASVASQIRNYLIYIIKSNSIIHFKMIEVLEDVQLRSLKFQCANVGKGAQSCSVFALKLHWNCTETALRCWCHSSWCEINRCWMIKEKFPCCRVPFTSFDSFTLTL